MSLTMSYLTSVKNVESIFNSIIGAKAPERFTTKFLEDTSYIAQVKKKCGLDMRDNYNKSQNDDYVAKQCTKEKEEIIKEALKYFGMIE